MRRGIIILTFFFSIFVFGNLGAYNLSLQESGEIVFEDFQTQSAKWDTSFSEGVEPAPWTWEGGELHEKAVNVRYSKALYTTQLSDCVILAKVKVTRWDGGDHCLVGICARSNSSPSAWREGYETVLWKTKNDFYLWYRGATGGDEKSDAYDFSWGTGTWYYMKLRVEGNKQFGKIWDERNPEPQEWHRDTTWAYLSSGYPGMVVDSEGGQVGQYAFDDFAVYSAEPINFIDVPDDYRIEFYDEEGGSLGEVSVSTITHQALLSGEHVSFPLQGYFEVYDEEGGLVLKTPVKQIWGGDRYNWVESEPPVCYSVNITPTSISAGEKITVKAVVDDSGKGDEDIAAAEYFVDTVGPDGSGESMRAADGAFDHWKEEVKATVSGRRTRDLCPGQHTIRVHGQDVSGLWGDFASGEFVVEEAGLPEARDVIKKAKLRNTLCYPGKQQKFMLSYSLPQTWPVRIVIYNLAGEKIINLIDQVDMPAGTHTHEWEGKDADGNSVASGEYLLYININGEERIEKIILIR